MARSDASPREARRSRSSGDPGRARDLGDLLQRIAAVAHGADRTSLGDILEHVAHRSFGLLILIPGLVTLAPVIGDIPGVPTLMAVLVLISAVQMLAGRDRPWLPRWLLDRSIDSGRLERAAQFVRPAARVVDRIVRPRFAALTGGRGRRVAAGAAALVALAMPAMEFVPFSANLAGAALTLLGVALFTGDGLVGAVGIAIVAAAVALVAAVLL